MKRLSCLLILLLFLCGCQSQDSLADNTLTVGLNDEFIPFEYRNDANELEGFDIDLAKALSEKLGVKLEIKTIDWEEIFEGLDQGEYDTVISGVSKTEERENSYSLSEPYISNGLVLVTKVGTKNPAKTYAETTGKNVGVQTGTAGDQAAEDLHDTAGRDVNVKKYENGTDLYNALKSGEIDYILDDVGVAAYHLKTESETFMVSSEEVITNEPLVIASSKNNEDLTEKINKALEELRADGTLKRLSEKWFGGDWTTDIDTEVRSAT